MTKNRSCLCCSTKFSYCPDCSRADRLKESWHSDFCSEPCKTLWTTLTKYSMNRLTKFEAKSIISELDLKSLDSYAPCVQRDYVKVMAEDPKPKRIKRIDIQPVEPTVVEETKIETQPEVVEETIREVVTIENE